MVVWLQSLKSYSVSDLHRTSVTCFEWSVNGMKLFSGDSAGVIVCTEFDFTVVCALQTCISKRGLSVVLLCDTHLVCF